MDSKSKTRNGKFSSEEPSNQESNKIENEILNHNDSIRNKEHKKILG